MSIDNREIDHNDMELFAAIIDSIEMHMPIDSATIEDHEDEIRIAREAAFRFFGMNLGVKTEKYYDYDGNVTGRSYIIALTRFSTIDDEKLISTDSCGLNMLSDNQAEWEVGYITNHRIQFGDEEPVRLLSDYIREEEEFYSLSPNEDQIDARRSEQETERALARSTRNPDRRFTKSRLQRIMPLLLLVDSEHILDEQSSENS